MTIPAWADEQLSRDLPALRAMGEGQQLEFKADFPPQGHDLGKEIASFATSGLGKILLGVADDGDLIGLSFSDAAERDGLWRRALGTVSSVKPPVNARVVFATEGAKTVLCIEILKQEEPVFYYDSRPYVRDGSISRPATPDEVKALVWSHPSSENKRFLEQSDRALIQSMQESSRSHAETMDEMRRLANKRLYGE